MKRTTGRLLRIFATGALAALPLAATVLIFWWAVNLLISWLGPDSPVGRVLGAVGLGVTESEVASYLIGLGLVASWVLWQESRENRHLAHLELRLDYAPDRCPAAATPP